MKNIAILTVLCLTFQTASAITIIDDFTFDDPAIGVPRVHSTTLNNSPELLFDGAVAFINDGGWLSWHCLSLGQPGLDMDLNLSYFNLGGVDLTENGASSVIDIKFAAFHGPLLLTMKFTDTAGKTRETVVPVLNGNLYVSMDSIPGDGSLGSVQTMEFKFNATGNESVARVWLGFGVFQNIGSPVDRIRTINVSQAPRGSVQLADWHNDDTPEDVNGDGFITARDARALVLYLNGSWSPGLTGDNDGLFLDVNNDGHISPRDVWAITHFINTFGAGPAP